MRKVIFYALASVTLMAACPVSAQVLILPPDARSDQALRNVETASVQAQRMATLTTELLADPRLATAPTPEALAALIEPRRSDYVAAQAQIQAIRANLAALPSVSDPDDPAHLQLTDHTVQSAVELADKLDVLMLSAINLIDAVRAGDSNKAMASVTALTTGGVVIMQAQAISLRAQATFVPQDNSSFDQLMALACLTDGVAAFQVGMAGGDRQESASGLRVAERCIRKHVGEARQKFEREKAAPPPPSVADFAARVILLYENMLDLLEEGGAVEASAADAMDRGDSIGSLVTTEFAKLQRVMTGIQANGAEIARIQADQLN
jgi:hypothetical protein